MDEEVVNDLYNQVVSKGYKKSLNDFIKLLHSDQESYSIQQSAQAYRRPQHSPFDNSFGSASARSLADASQQDVAPQRQSSQHASAHAQPYEPRAQQHEQNDSAHEQQPHRVADSQPSCGVPSHAQEHP